MTDLIHRIETAPEPSREIFEEAFKVLDPLLHADGVTARSIHAWIDFTAMLNAQAWTSAAEMLVPDGWRIASLYQDASDGSWACGLSNDAGRFGNGGSRCYAAAHPALALLASILRASGHE